MLLVTITSTTAITITFTISTLLSSKTTFMTITATANLTSV